jgi:hypothetical protein
MGKKGSAKRYMQQRKNIADAKTKLVDHVKQTYIDPIKKDLAAPKEPRAKLGSWEGKVSTYLGLDPASNEDANIVQSPQTQTRPEHFETGVTEHLPENVVSMADFMERKKGINE